MDCGHNDLKTHIREKLNTEEKSLKKENASERKWFKCETQWRKVKHSGEKSNNANASEKKWFKCEAATLFQTGV